MSYNKKSHYINWANVSPWNCWLSPINQYKSPKKHPKICPHKFSINPPDDSRLTPLQLGHPRCPRADSSWPAGTARRPPRAGTTSMFRWLSGWRRRPTASNSWGRRDWTPGNGWFFPYLTIFDQIYPFHLLSFQINLQAAEVEINGSASPSWATAAAPWAAVPPRSAAPCPAPSAAPRGRRWKQWRRLRGPSLALGRGSMPCYYGDSTRWHHRLPKNSKATTCTYILRQRPMHVDPHNMIIYVGILTLPYEVK